MKFLIYGAGAVGGYLGTLLSSAGHDVTLISRSNAEHIAENGLTLIRNSGRRIMARPQAVSSLRQAMLDDARYDYMILTMKSYDVAAALNEMSAFCPNPPTIVTMQNGIGIEDQVVEQFGEDRVIAGSFTVPVTYVASFDVVEQVGGRGVALAGMRPKLHPKKLAGVMEQAGIKTMTSGNYASMKWSKVLSNVLGNATAAILNRTPEIVYKYKPTYQMEVKMMGEILAVMENLNIPIMDLPGASVTRLVQAIKWLPDAALQPLLARHVTKGRGDKMPSFQMDLATGKDKNEVVYHNGAVNMIGREIGVSTPINGALTDILLQIAHEEVSWELYDGKPKVLIEAVNEHIRNNRAAA